MASPRPPELGTLTSARFLAALVVVFSHYQLIVPQHGPWVPALTQGQAGVSFFFVPSGFILTYNYHAAFQDGVRSGALWAYYRARFARIFPLHALALVAIAPLAVAAGAHHLPWAWPGWWVDLAMLQGLLPFPAAIFAWNTPDWSISCEMAFYLALPFLVAGLARRVGSDRAAVAWLVGLWLVGTALGLGLLVAGRHLPEATELVFKYTPWTRGWQFAVGCVAGLWHLAAHARPEAFPGYRRWFARPGLPLAVGLA